MVESLYQIDGAEGPWRVQTNGIELGVFCTGPQNGTPVVLCHGFPELAYSWRHQIPALAKAGYRVIAPDLRGYGHSTRPTAINAYDLETICQDLIGLLDALGVSRAIVAGHDWGGALAWHFPLRHPHRVIGVIGINYPFVPRHPTGSLINIFRHKFGDDMYVVQFQAPGVAEAVLEKNPLLTIEFFMRKPDMTIEQFTRASAKIRSLNFLEPLRRGDHQKWARECLLTQRDRQIYAQTFAHTGFRGALNWYRNIERNWQNSADLPQTIEHPCLMIMADQDVILPPSSADGMEKYVPNLDKYLVRNCGHWTMQQHPKEVNEVAIDWLNKTTK